VKSAATDGPTNERLNTALAPRARWAKDAHKVDFVKIHYRFHPYFGQTLKVLRVDKDRVCVKSPDGENGRALPTWMTDEEMCRQIEISSRPYCCWKALRSLLELLRR
jgi:hypothetical protein